MEFKKYTVEELVKLDMLEKPMDGNHGSKHPTSKDYVKEGIPFVMVSDINNGRINYKTCKFISKKTRDNLDKGFAKPKDVLLSHKATIGLTAIIGDEFEEIVLTPQLTYYRVKNNINNKYLKYYFDSLYFQNILKNWATSGSTRAYLGITAQLKLPILLPDINNQNKIANILSTIDRKIELNSQINNKLHELGDELYKEYYLRFINNLPEGYEIKCLNEVAQKFDSKRKPMSSREREIHRGIYPYYGATSIIDYVDNYIFNDTYVLMGEDGTVKTEKGNPVLQYIWGKNWVNNHAHVLKGIKISTEHLYFALRNVNIESLITGAVQPKINQENMNKIKFIIGNDEINSEFEKISGSIMQKSKLLIEENKILGQLRDALLPKLMNGEINLDKIKC